jgi:hypothetical protein
MTAEAAAPSRPVNIFVFSALCLAAALAWDVAYALVCDHLGRTMTDLMPPWTGLAALLGVPMLLCFALGFGLRQWGAERSPWLRTGAALWCMVAPLIVLLPFFNLMCFAFDSCFGD